MINFNSLEESWERYALDNNYSWILIVKDLEDKDIFPVYFNSEKDADKYEHNIVSESKLKVLDKINLTCK